MVKVDGYGVSHSTEDGCLLHTLEGTVVLHDLETKENMVFEPDSEDFKDMVYKVADIEDGEEDAVDERLEELVPMAIAQDKAITCTEAGVEGLTLIDKDMEAVIGVCIVGGKAEFVYYCSLKYDNTNSSYLKMIDDAIRAASERMEEKQGVALPEGFEIDFKYQYVENGFVYHGALEVGRHVYDVSVVVSTAAEL